MEYSNIRHKSVIDAEKGLYPVVADDNGNGNDVDVIMR